MMTCVRAGISLLLLGVVFSVCVQSSLMAQTPRKRVLDDADQIFQRPEFQKFRNGMPTGEKPGQSVTFGSGGSGSGGNSEQRGSGSPGPSSHKDENTDQEKKTSPSESSSSSRSPLFPSSSFGDFGVAMAGLFQIMGIVVLIAMIGLVLWLVIPAIINRDRSLGGESVEEFLDRFGQEENSRERPRFSVDQYLEAARKAAGENQYREAVGYMLLAGMAEIETRGLIKPRVGMTHREFYRAVKQDAQMGPAYRGLLRLYEPLGFGRREAEQEHFDEAVRAYETGFRS